jgi:molybdate-binding protein
VAAFVASGMADVGFGVEVPACEFKLEYLPCEQERYFMLCEAHSLESPDMHRELQLLRSADYRDAVSWLPGYQAGDCGAVITLQ